MANLSTTQVARGVGEFYINTTAGSTPYSWIGFTDGGITVTDGEETETITCDQSDHPLFELTTGLSASYSTTLMEDTLANVVAFSQGATLSGTTVTFGESTNTEIAVSVVVPVTGTTHKIITSLYARVSGNRSRVFTKRGYHMLPITVNALKRSGVALKTEYQYDLATTIAETAALTRVSGQVHHIVTSFSGSSDTLTTITGESLTDDEYLVLRPAAGQAITVTDDPDSSGEGVICLTGASTDWIMNNPDDRLVLQYDSSEETWTEIERVDA